MTLRLLIDEDSQGKVLLNKLRRAGHDVQTVHEANLSGRIDDVVFQHAIMENRIILTQNCADFVQLHLQLLKLKRTHPGVLLVYKENHAEKDMNAVKIVIAIANLENTGLKLNNQVIILNKYNY